MLNIDFATSQQHKTKNPLKNKDDVQIKIEVRQHFLPKIHDEKT